MPTTQSADGIKHEFPEGTDPSVIDKVMKDYATQQAPHSAAPEVTPQRPSPPVAGALGHVDAMVAGAQGISPQLPEKAKLAPVEEQWKFLELGVPSNQQKYVAARNPDTGQYAVYERSPEMEESKAAALGRALSLGVPEGGIPAVATPAVPTAAQKLMQDFSQAKVNPNLPAVGQGRSAGLVSQIGHTLPVVGPQVRSAVNKTLGDTAAAAESTAARFGTASTPEQGGEAAQKGLTGFAKGTFPQNAERLYEDFERHLDPSTPADLTNTRQALQTPMDRFPSSPELGAQLTNPKLRAYSQALESGKGLTFGELKELRSTVGRQLGDPVLMNDIPRADLKRVYGAISQDMEAAAAAKGPDASKAFQRANRYYRAGLERIDRIEPLLSGPPEKAFDKINRAAGQGGGADAGLLEATRKSMSPAEWNDVGAAVVRRLGEPTPNAKDVLADTNFSVASFSTNWNKLSPAAKDSLFGSNVPDSPRAAIETLARISQAQKNIGKLTNVSRTGEFGLWALMAGLGLEHYQTFIQHPISTIGGGALAYGASKALMSPGFAKWMYRMPETMMKAPNSMVGMQRAMSQLDVAARADRAADKQEEEQKPREAPPQRASITPAMPKAGLTAADMMIP